MKRKVVIDMPIDDVDKTMANALGKCLE